MATDDSEGLRARYERLRESRDRARDAYGASPADVFCKASYERLATETNEAYVTWLESTWRLPLPH